MPKVFRLVSFNILEGLRPLARSSSERRLIDRARRDAARAVVAELDPDILVLNEALFCREFAAMSSTMATSSSSPIRRLPSTMRLGATPF